MEYRAWKKQNGAGESIRTSLLGYGCMRFPTTPEGAIDEPRAEALLNAARDAGVNYFDTAYPYHGGQSEPFVGRVIAKWPRESFYLATKMPLWQCGSLEEAQHIFEEQLRRLGVEYIDFYLLHSLYAARYDRAKEMGIVDWLWEQKKLGRIKITHPEEKALRSEQIQSDNEIPMQESIDKLTIQIALIAVAYLLAYLLMVALGELLPSMKSVIFGFNFLLGVLTATLVKLVMGWLKKKGVIKKEYTNSFLMTRASNFFFDIMVVAGIAAIRFSVLKNYWGIILIMGVVGLVITYVYNYIVAKKLFPEYTEEQFLTMYGMLTGTASTGVILLREIDGEFKTPALDNMVYQNFPAIVFGFPMMLLATFAPVKPVLTLLILIVFFAAMNVILFRSLIFRRKSKNK